MQACKAMLFNAMNLKGRVSKITIFSVNPRTALSVNSAILDGKDLKTACLDTQSAHLAAELGQMLGGKVQLSETRKGKVVKVDQDSFALDRLQKMPARQRPFEYSYLLESDKEEFMKAADEFAKRIQPGASIEFINSLFMGFDFLAKTHSIN